MSEHCNSSDQARTVPLSDLVNEVKIFLPNVADGIIQATLVRAAMQLSDKAKLLSETLVQDFFCGVSKYPVESKSCGTIVKVESVHIGGSKVNFNIPEQGWIEIDECDINKSSCKRCLEVKVFAGVSRQSCEIPTEMFERYGHVIINMTLGMLYGMNGEDWYDANLVRFYGGLGAGGINDAKQDVVEQTLGDGIDIGVGGLAI